MHLTAVITLFCSARACVANGNFHIVFDCLAEESSIESIDMCRLLYTPMHPPQQQQQPQQNVMIYSTKTLADL